MEKQIIFRDYQEQQAQDHLDLQDFARDSIDHIINDVVTATRRYADFSVTKTTQTEVQITSGRFYDTDGSIYHKGTTTTQSMVTYLPAVSKRYVLVTAYGTETETDVEERDFLVDVTTGRTEPSAVASVSSRDAVLAFTQGTESADPQIPATPATHVAIATILLDTTQVVTVTQLTDNRVTSTEDLDERTDDLETFRALIEPRVAALASDLAALAELLKKMGRRAELSQLYIDMARVKERVDIPSTATDYGADRFLDLGESDYNNTAGLGYDAKVEEGVRFATANQDIFTLDIFAANDPNATVTGGLLLPRWDHEGKLGNASGLDTTVGLAQFGFQSLSITALMMGRNRLRYGSSFWVANTSTFWRSGQYDYYARTFTIGAETFEVLDMYETSSAGYWWIRLKGLWQDGSGQDYWNLLLTEYPISGAQIAQTVLIPNDMWLTKFGFYLWTKAADEALHITITKTTNGMPDLSKAILQQTVPHTGLYCDGTIAVPSNAGGVGWVAVTVPPTFLKGGERYAFCFASNANHELAVTSETIARANISGNLFYNTDGQFFQGDLTQDLLIYMYAAKFENSQSAVELEAWNLDGGIRDIDLIASNIIPDSTSMIFEIQPGATGAWRALTADDLTALDGAPPLCRARIRFVGSYDMQSAIKLTDSQCTLSRIKTTFKHVSSLLTLATSSQDIYVRCILEGFNDTPHDFTMVLRHDTTNVSPTSTTDVALPDLPEITNRVQRTFLFEPLTGITEFRLIADGATNSATAPFVWSERIYWRE